MYPLIKTLCVVKEFIRLLFQYRRGVTTFFINKLVSYIFYDRVCVLLGIRCAVGDTFVVVSHANNVSRCVFVFGGEDHAVVFVNYS